MFEGINRQESSTGASLAYRHQAAVGAARGILLICHGLAEHSGRYGEFARFMSGRGFHVYAHDHRGHGHTSAPDATVGRFARRHGVGKVLEDVQAIRDLAARAHPGLPVILFGHSMGGLAALNAAVDNPGAFEGLSIWNSNFHPGPAGRFAQGVLLTEKALKGADVPSTILPIATFRAWGRSMPEKRTEADWLSSQPEEVDAYNADPLCGFDASVSLWLDVFALTFRGPRLIDRLPKDMPVYLVGGDTDPATNGGREITWLAHQLRSKGLTRLTSRIWPDTRHETLKDKVRHKAMEEFASWASGALSPAE
ncbi:alpha-beta hydrolase superfamily lysophospholipase [Pseudorhizobium tarimense]|uniref:Alpha-beta hydrolase superfamily lysophospholipase n=1 Tax=Pseudorhizobium tarimense TaxID=1079109 RepID=A0ABV2H3L5_9HYPH|nr:alpha/beta hydrolase [Pseudorhizobium tarimense]MCJ8518444.1 alpha/beta hydrolase [Pseudorhizobium tarimense]